MSSARKRAAIHKAEARALTAVRQYPGVEEYLGTIITGLIDTALTTPLSPPETDDAP